MVPAQTFGRSAGRPLHHTLLCLATPDVTGQLGSTAPARSARGITQGANCCRNSRPWERDDMRQIRAADPTKWRKGEPCCRVRVQVLPTNLLKFWWNFIKKESPLIKFRAHFMSNFTTSSRIIFEAILTRARFHSQNFGRQTSRSKLRAANFTRQTSRGKFSHANFAQACRSCKLQQKAKTGNYTSVPRQSG